MEKFNKLENEVNSLSEKIDSVNSKTEIEVKITFFNRLITFW